MSTARLLSLIALVGAAAALPDFILDAIDDDAAITTLEKMTQGRFHSAARGRGETAARRPPKQAHEQCRHSHLAHHCPFAALRHRPRRLVLLLPQPQE